MAKDHKEMSFFTFACYFEVAHGRRSCSSNYLEIGMGLRYLYWRGA